MVIVEARRTNPCINHRKLPIPKLGLLLPVLKHMANSRLPFKPCFEQQGKRKSCVM